MADADIDTNCAAMLRLAVKGTLAGILFRGKAVVIS